MKIVFNVCRLSTTVHIYLDSLLKKGEKSIITYGNGSWSYMLADWTNYTANKNKSWEQILGKKQTSSSIVVVYSQILMPAQQQLIGLFERMEQLKNVYTYTTSRAHSCT